MKSTCFISFIIPVYNCKEPLLRRCLNSVSAQSVSDYEVIIVDDGSTNNSGRICDEYAEKNDNIKVFHKVNGGVASARNRGISEASGEWVFFIDNDDWIEGNTVETALKWLNDSKCDFAIFDTNQIKGKKTERVYALEYRTSGILNSQQQEFLLLDFVAEGYAGRKITASFLPVWFKAYRRSFIKKNGICFDEKMTIADDVMFNIDCCIHSENGTMYIAIPLYNRFMDLESDSHRYHPEITKNDKLFLNHLSKSLSGLNDNQKINDALLKRYVICAMGVIRYDMIHPNNPKKLKERYKDFLNVTRSQPYKKAIKDSKAKWFAYTYRPQKLLLQMNMEGIYLIAGSFFWKMYYRVRHLL